MTTTITPGATSTAPQAELGVVGSGRWIERWDANDDHFWAGRGRAIARRNLGFSIFAEHIGFSVWMLWSIVVVSMSGTFDASGALVTSGANGWALTAGQALTVLGVASGVGALLRIPYTFAVPVFGGRNWTVVSALLLLVPTLGLAWVVQHPEVPSGCSCSSRAPRASAAATSPPRWPTSPSSTPRRRRAGPWA
jgi:NNP family nitrate/nitrite transporter-like MFS transporter